MFKLQRNLRQLLILAGSQISNAINKTSLDSIQTHATGSINGSQKFIGTDKYKTRVPI